MMTGRMTSTQVSPVTPDAPAAQIEIIKIGEVCRRVGLKRAGLYRAVQHGLFPKPIKMSTRASGWVVAEVNSWLRGRMAARDA